MKYLNLNMKYKNEHGLNEAFAKRLEEYERVKNRLPKHFTKAYEAYNAFHDIQLLKLTMDTEEVSDQIKDVPRLSIALGWYSEHIVPQYTITYHDVVDFSMQHNDEVKYSASYKKSFALWYTDEFSEEDEYLVHNIMLLGGGEINIKFKKFTFIVL